MAGTTVEWASWAKHGTPVWEGWAIAADPSVVRDGDLLRMYYTAWLPERDRTVIAEVASTDGLAWTPAVPVDGDNPAPVVLDGIEGTWQDRVETAEAVLRPDGIWLYYAGYPQVPDDVLVAPGEVGLALSSDGVDFARVGDGPVLARTAGGMDNDAIYSPAVVWWGEQAWMIYAGHCWTDCGEAGPGLRILGATSPDGVAWTKHGAPVLEAATAGVSWAASGVAEPDLVEGPDGLLYIFFSAFSGDDGEDVVIGVARSPHPFGPWEVAPEPVVASSDPTGWEGHEVIAPSVLVEDGRVRLWYHGLSSPDPDYRIGYAEAPWPLVRIATHWERSEANPVALPFGTMTDGATDLGLADPTVVWDADDGIFKAWWSTTVAGLYGPDGPSVNGIRYAESPDGVAWTVQEELAFAASWSDPSAWDHTHAETPFVVKVPGNSPERRYLLYYSGGDRDACTVGGAPCYEIGLAYSADGRFFTRLPAGESPYGEEGLVLRGEDVVAGVEGVDLGIVADPTLVLEPDGTLRMWMSTYAQDASGTPLLFGISHASSPDGIHWTPSPENPLPSLRREGEAASGQQPSVLWNPGRGLYEMWFTNDRPQDTARVPATLFQAFGFWHATSPDGIHWTPEYGAEPDLRWDPAFPGERWGMLTGVHVLLHGGEYRAYYSGWSSVGVPPLFVAPTQAGLVPTVTALNLATWRPSRGAARPSGRVVGGR